MKYRYTFEGSDKEGNKYIGELVAGGAISAMGLVKDKLDFASLVRTGELDDSVPSGIVELQAVTTAKRYYYSVKISCDGENEFVGGCIAESMQQVLDLFDEGCRVLAVEQQYEVEATRPICVCSMTEVK